MPSLFEQLPILILLIVGIVAGLAAIKKLRDFTYLEDDLAEQTLSIDEFLHYGDRLRWEAFNASGIAVVAFVSALFVYQYLQSV